MTNISENKTESENKYRDITELSPDGIVTMTVSGMILSVNKAFVKLSGFKKEDFVDRHFTKIPTLLKQDLNFYISLFAKIVSGNLKQPIEFKWKNSKGETRIGKANVRLIRENNNSKYILCIVKDITELKKQEIELKNSEEKYRNIVENSIQGLVIVLDNPVKIVFASNPMKNITGYSPGELINLKPEQLAQLIHPDDRDRFFGTFTSRLKGKDVPLRSEYKLIHKDTSKKWVEVYSSVITIDGKPASQTAFLDITERKRAEEKLKESEAKFRGVLENIQLIGIMLNTDGKIVFANDYFLDLTGWRREDIIGKDWFTTFLPLKVRKQVRGFFDESLVKGNMEVSYTNEIITKSGDERIISWNNTLHYDENNNIISLTSIGEDITEKKEIEETLRKSEENYRFITENTNDIIWVLDIDDNRFNFISNSVKNILGFTSAELIDKGMEYVLDQDSLEKILEEIPARIERFKNGINEVFTDILKQKCKNGSAIWTEVRARYVINENNGHIEAIGVSRDISERIKVEKQVKESEEKYRLLLENSGAGVGYWDLEGNILLFNAQAASYMGGKPHDFIGKNIMELYGKDWGGYYLKRIKKAAKTEKSIDYQDWIDINKNQKIHFTSTYTRVENNDGKVIGVQIVSRDTTLQKAAEKALVESKEQYDLAMNATSDGLFDWNLVTNEIYYSPRWKSMLGYKDHELKNEFSVWEKLTDPEDVKKSWEMLNDHIAGKTDRFEMEFKMKHKDGHWVDILARANAYKDDNGKAYRLVGTHIDITEKKQSEKKLKESESKHRQAQEVAKIGHWELDSVSSTPRWSDEIYRIFGLEPGKGKPSFTMHDTIIHPDEWPVLQKSIEDGFAKGKPFDLIFKILRPDNKMGWMHAIGKVEKDSAGQIVKMYGTAQDITETKKAEKALIESEERYQQLVETAADAIYLIDENGKIADTNQCACDMLQRSKEEILELTIGDIDLNYPLEDFLQFWKETPFNEQRIFETSHTRKDGTTIPVEVSGKKFKQGNKIYYYGIARDITERKKAEFQLVNAKEKAEEADRLKSAFLANMSHEIRTPMNGILGFTDLLKRPNLSGEETEKYIDVIQKSGHRMLATLNDIIDISKIDSGQVEIAKNEINIYNEIESLYFFFRQEASKKGLEFKLDNRLPVHFANIYTDKVKLYSIISNLIKNAIKFTDKGSIEIACRKNASELEVKVTDTGIGIPKSRIRSIFNRFEQADISDIHAREGSGLGLSITKAYVEMLGGHIGVESTEGKGSVFSITIPWVENANKTATATINEELNVSSGNKLDILIVEDDEISFEHLKIILKEKAKNISRVKNGKDAIDFIKNNTDTQLVLMDIKLPVLNGAEATREIRKFNKKVIIIAQTAYALSGDREKAMEAGCNDYVSKPIDKEKLFELIDKYH